jgi:hypothetical protein
MHLEDTGCEEGKCMFVAVIRLHWRALESAQQNLHVPL